jgi:hypothetical protein
MTERNLKLIKSDKSQSAPAAGREGEAKPPAPRLVSLPAQPAAEADVLTEAEAAEAARFRELIAARAARQAMLRRIIAELEDWDEIWSAA